MKKQKLKKIGEHDSGCVHKVVDFYLNFEI